MSDVTAPHERQGRDRGWYALPALCLERRGYPIGTDLLGDDQVAA